MKKLAKDLKPGDVLSAIHKKPVVRFVYPEGDGANVLFEDGHWVSYGGGFEFEVKPRTIPASEVRPGMTVRPEGTNVPMVVERAVYASAFGTSVYLLGHLKSSQAQVWLDLDDNYQCEVIA